MRTTYSNCQVRTDSQEAVVAALTVLLKEPASVSPAIGGWVGVYPEGEATNPDELAEQLSAKLSRGVFSWHVYDSDVFLTEATKRSAQVVEMLRAAGAME